MSLTEPTARPAAAGNEAPAGELVRTPAESPRPRSYLRSMNGGLADDARDWADDDRLDELFSAWAKAAVATDDTTAGFSAADERSRPAPTAPTEARPGAATVPAEPEIEPFARPTFAPDDDFGVTPTVTPTVAATVDPDVPWEPVTAWTRTEDDIIPQRRRSRWGRRVS